MYKNIGDKGIDHSNISSVKLESKAPRVEMNEVILFEHANFQGIHHHVFTEDYDLRNTGMNDLTSSIVIKSGKWAFFKDINCVGQYQPELGPGMYRNVSYRIRNDAISSVRLKEIKRVEAILFEHTNFQGRHHHIFAQNSGEGDPYLPRTGMNDKTSSVIVISGEWAFYSNANYAGKYDTTLPPGMYKDFNFSGCDIKNDKVSSVNLFK